MGKSVLLVAATLGAGLVTSGGPTSAGEIPAARVPTGFVVNRAAPDGSVRFPMFATHDERGRLFVAESSGLDPLRRDSRRNAQLPRQRCWRTATATAASSHFTRLRRRSGLPDGPGSRRRQPLRRQPARPRRRWRMPTATVTQADRRTVILTGFGHTDNGSLHGLTFGPDGRLHMTMGVPDGYRLAMPDGSYLVGTSGALLRCRPDGSRPEAVCRGFVNLVEVIFLPGGDAIGTDNWYQLPADGFRDAPGSKWSMAACISTSLDSAKRTPPADHRRPAATPWPGSRPWP